MGSGYVGKTYAAKKLTWNEKWKMEKNKLKFASVYDVLPFHSSLVIWKLTDDSVCGHCGRRPTQEHILSPCPKSLFRGRHDQVLEAMANGINTAVKNAKGKQRRPELIKFVKADTTLASKTSIRGNTAGSAGSEPSGTP